MKIAVDISPISKGSTSAHKVRGVGAYINMLVNNLSEIDTKNEYKFVENNEFADADLVHFPYFDPFFRTLPFGLNKKFVVTVHDLTPLVFPNHFPAGVKGKVNWQFQKLNLKKASKVVVDSNCSAKDVQRIAGVDKDKIVTVYLSASESFKKLMSGSWEKETIKKYNLPDNFLLYVGDATWNKNLPRLIEAVKNTNHKIVMVGKVWETEIISDNPWNDDLKHVMLEIDKNPQFINLGFVDDDDVVRLYNLATALVMPSLYEGFGLPVLEAMKCACPVISSKGGSLPEIGGDAVEYIDEYNIESIVEAINRVMASKSLQESLSKKGLLQAKNFTVEKSINDLVAVYNSI